MNGHQPNYTEFSPLAVEAPSEGALCVYPGTIILWEYIGFLLLSKAGTKILRARSFSLISATVPDP